MIVATCRVVITTSTAVSPYWSRNDPIYQVIFSTVLVPYKMHAESWELDLNSEFRVLTSWISLTLSSTIQNACNNKNDLKVGIDFQCSMNMVPKCRAQFMHDWIPAVLSARTRDCRRRPDLIARAENHNSTQPGCHVASRTRSTDLQKMTWYFRSFPVRGYEYRSQQVLSDSFARTAPLLKGFSLCQNFFGRPQENYLGLRTG